MWRGETASIFTFSSASWDTITDVYLCSHVFCALQDTLLTMPAPHVGGFEHSVRVVRLKLIAHRAPPSTIVVGLAGVRGVPQVLLW